MKHLTSLILVIAISTAIVNPLPQGAPSSVCQSLKPFHGGGISPQGGIPPYNIIPRRQDGRVLVTVTSSLGIPFQGFMLQGRTPRRDILGEFNSNIQDGHLLECNGQQDTVTHNSPNDKQTLEFEWTPPNGFTGFIVFNATVAQGYDTFWVGVESPPIEISKRSINDPAFNIPGPPRASTVPTYLRPAQKEAATEFDPFYDGCANTKLCFGAPANCVDSKSCKAVVAVTVQGDKYDFEIKADGNAQWVGVGLSDDEKMGDDSVIECVQRGNGVAAYMSWTSGTPNYGAARLSNPQLGISLLNGSVVDGTIYCKIRREAQTLVNGRNFDLINKKYNLLIASGSNVKATGVGFHDLQFLASGNQQALADVSTLQAASKLLIRLHGCFMLAAWLGTASVGMLLARYYKQTWVGNTVCGKDMWFAWHRLFMVLTWALTMVAFVLIFVELRAWSGENNPHAILGTVTTILCFFQPIGAYFRPHPGTAKRPLFNWVHWLVGNAAHIVAIVTIFFAVQLTKAELPKWVDYILATYVVIYVICHLALSIMGCLADKNGDRRISSFPMKDLNTGRNGGYPDQSGDAEYSTFRKCALAIYIVITLVILITLLVVTAMAPISETWTQLRSTVMNH